MAAAKPVLLACLILGALAAASASALPAGCRRPVGECLAGDGPGLHDHDGRVDLYGYISYGALKRDTVPCSSGGASYYNCRPGGQANPYHRGCSQITRCRG